MFNKGYRIGIALLVLGFLICNVFPSEAQIAPTNSATISGSVSDPAGKPLGAVTIAVKGPRDASTQTDSHGQFVFVGMPFGDYQLDASISQFGTATRALSIHGDTNVAIQYEPMTVNGLKTIASVSASANASFNITPASVTQVSPMQNAFEGKTSWRTILEQIPGVAQAGLVRGSVVNATAPDSPLVPMKISINGALPYETATLLDDMPIIGGSGNTIPGTGTDLGVYPLNAFASADVVRGPGANAPSIVDSIGGSFVLHAPGPVTKTHYQMSASSDPYGGVVLNALAAFRAGKLSAQFTYGVNDSPGPLADQGIPATLAVTTVAVDGKPFTAYVPPTCSLPTCSANMLVNPSLSGGSIFNSFYGYQKGLLVCCGPEMTAWSQHSGSVALHYVLSSKMSADIFYAGATSRMAQLSNSFTDNFAPPPGYAGEIPAGSLVLSLTGDQLVTAPVEQSSTLLEEKMTAQIGPGTLQIAALQNQTRYTRNYSTPASATLQLFGAGTLNGVFTIFNGDTHVLTFTPTVCTTAIQISNRDMLASYAASIGEAAHAGISFVSSYYNDPSYTYAFSGTTPTVSRSIPSAISETTNELRIFVGGNPSQKTSFDLSGYFVNVNYHVPDPKNAVSYTIPGVNIAYTDAHYTYAAPRLGFVWRPSARVALRASAGGGFAEAPLGYLVGNNGSCASTATTCSITLLNLNLQPEKSFAFDIGTDIRLRGNTIVSLDAYRATLYGQLYSSATFNGIGTCPGNTTAPCFVTANGNLGVSRFEGVLMDVRHDVPRGTYWSLSGGLTRGYVVSVPAGFYNAGTATCNLTTAVGCTSLNVVPGANFNGTYTNGASVPYAQALAKAGYRWAPEKFVGLVATYYGNNNTYFRPAFVEFDGQAGYPLTKNISLELYFRNITGIYDAGVQTWSPAGMLGAPVVAGSPFAQYGEEYGPRTVLLTVGAHF